MFTGGLWCVFLKDSSKWSRFYHLVLNGECLFVVFTHYNYYSFQKEWCVGIHKRNDKESHTFPRQMPLILQHDVDTDVSLTYLSSFSINQ